jgi:hypothetical protein
METVISKKGFAGVTFSVRGDIRFGIRPIPYYQYDGNDLQPIKTVLFKQGIPASLAANKLRISGTNNCLVLADFLQLNNDWTSALRTIFLTGQHRTEEGIKFLFDMFGQQSRLSTNEVNQIIEQYKNTKLNSLQKKAMGTITLLPTFDRLYDTIDIVHTTCQQCQSCGVKIYFTGKYPRNDNIVLLCTACAEAL